MKLIISLILNSNDCNSTLLGQVVEDKKKKRLNSYERVTHDSKYDSLLGVINSQGKKCKLVSGDGINPYRRDPENISILKPFTEYVQWFQSVNNRACMLSHVRLFVTLWTVGSPPGSSVHGISPARILEWVTMPSSRGSSWPWDRTRISCIGRQILYPWAIWEAPTIKH